MLIIRHSWTPVLAACSELRHVLSVGRLSRHHTVAEELQAVCDGPGGSDGPLKEG